MNTVNGSLVTTGKVNLLKAQRPPSQAEKRKRIRNLIGIFFISVILFALITGSTLVALIRKYNIGFQHRQVQETAQAFCSMTEHVPACHRSISTHFTTASRHKWEGRPDDIFVLSLQLATEQLSNLTSLTKSLISKSSNNYHHSRSDTSPLQQCTSLIHDSLDRLNSSLTTSAGVLLFSQTMENESLAIEKTDYLMPKINDSVSDLRTCFEILEQVKSVSVDEVSRRVHSAMVDAGMAFDFLQNRGDIKYRLQFLDSSSIPDVNFGYLTTILMSLPQYLILVLVFWFLSRMV